MNLHAVIVFFGFAVCSLVHGDELRKTPDYFSQQFAELSKERLSFKRASDKLGEKALEPEYSLKLLALKHKHMAGLTKVITSIESILDSRPPASIEQELARDLDAIGRYTDLYYASLRDSYPGGDRHIVASKQIEYLFMRAEARVKYCRDTLKWDYEFKSLLKDLWLHPRENQNGEQGGADQPATAPESKPQGNHKPKPESEVRPQ